VICAPDLELFGAARLIMVLTLDPSMIYRPQAYRFQNGKVVSMQIRE
jgi:hypothetical protein